MAGYNKGKTNFGGQLHEKANWASNIEICGSNPHSANGCQFRVCESGGKHERPRIAPGGTRKIDSVVNWFEELKRLVPTK